MECLGYLILTTSAIKPIDSWFSEEGSTPLFIWLEGNGLQTIVITMPWILCCYLGPLSSQFDLLIGDDTT